MSRKCRANEILMVESCTVGACNCWSGDHCKCCDDCKEQKTCADACVEGNCADCGSAEEVTTDDESK